MDRRKFFKKLGLTAAVAAIAPKLFAGESAPTYKGGTLNYYASGKHYAIPYLKGYKKPFFYNKYITVMTLPRQHSWDKHIIILRDVEHDFHVTLEVDTLDGDFYAICILDKKVATEVKPVVTDRIFVWKDYAPVKDETWQ